MFQRILITGSALILFLVLPMRASAHARKGAARLSQPLFQPLFQPNDQLTTITPALAVTVADTPTVDPGDKLPRVSNEVNGLLPTRDGLRLRLNTDLGNVRILTDASGQVSYHITLEADARDPRAQKIVQEFSVNPQQTSAGVALTGQLSREPFSGRLWVTYEIHVPRKYSIEVTTQAGDVEVHDIDGRVAVATGGGNISVGRVGPANTSSQPYKSGVAGPEAIDGSPRIAVRLVTQGGHITVGNVAGDLRAVTAGGHITTGDTAGDATLQTEGGHIVAGRIAGTTLLETGGGNIQIESAGTNVTANSDGGQINLGQVAGTVRANTDGGDLQIGRVSGATVVETSAGNVFLRQVGAPVRVLAAAGSINAWFDAGATDAQGSRKMLRSSQLISKEGNITVYLPRERSLTIDAAIEQSGAHRIVADPALPLKTSYAGSSESVGAFRYQGTLNGGGEVLQLKAISGNIMIKLAGPNPAQTTSIEDRGAAPATWNSGASEDKSDAENFVEEIRRRVEISWWGGVPIDSAELQKHLQQSVNPVYPDVARKAGIEGDVILRAYVASDGRVSNLKLLAGPPILARAAIDAIAQWRYQPVLIDGRPASVVTTLTVAFRLQ